MLSILRNNKNAYISATISNITNKYLINLQLIYCKIVQHRKLRSWQQPDTNKKHN